MMSLREVREWEDSCLRREQEEIIMGFKKLTRNQDSSGEQNVEDQPEEGGLGQVGKEEDEAALQL